MTINEFATGSNLVKFYNFCAIIDGQMRREIMSGQRLGDYLGWEDGYALHDIIKSESGDLELSSYFMTLYKGYSDIPEGWQNPVGQYFTKRLVRDNKLKYDAIIQNLIIEHYNALETNNMTKTGNDSSSELNNSSSSLTKTYNSTITDSGQSTATKHEESNENWNKETHTEKTDEISEGTEVDTNKNGEDKNEEREEGTNTTKVENDTTNSDTTSSIYGFNSQTGVPYTKDNSNIVNSSTTVNPTTKQKSYNGTFDHYEYAYHNKTGNNTSNTNFTDTGNSSVELDDNISNTSTNTQTKGGSDTDSTRSDGSKTINNSTMLNTHGNIGNIPFPTLIEYELTLRFKYDISRIILNDIVKLLCRCVYKND